MKKLITISALSFALIGLSACGGAPATPAAPAKIYSLNEAIDTPKYELKITKVEEKASVGNEFMNEKASEGAVIVGVQYSVKNISDKPMGAFDQPQLKLVDDKGTEYNSDAGKSGTYAMVVDPNQKIMSDLNPGITVKGATAFEVSKELFSRDKWQLKTLDGTVISLAAPSASKK